MPRMQPTVDDVTTTNTLEVWRDKLNREERCAASRDQKHLEHTDPLAIPLPDHLKIMHAP